MMLAFTPGGPQQRNGAPGIAAAESQVCRVFDIGVVGREIHHAVTPVQRGIDSDGGRLRMEERRCGCDTRT